MTNETTESASESGNTVEMHLTVEEQADDLIDMLMAEEGSET